MLVTGRLLAHFENLSARLYSDGELRQDGEPKAGLARLLDLSEQIRRNLQAIFGADERKGDLASAMAGQE